MQIPAHVRAGIEAIIGGGAVVTAVSQYRADSRPVLPTGW